MRLNAATGSGAAAAICGVMSMLGSSAESMGSLTARPMPSAAAPTTRPSMRFAVASGMALLPARTGPACAGVKW